MNDLLNLLILLFLSGFFSGSETALVSLSMARADGLVREGRPGAEALHRLKEDPQRMLITILIGNNLVNIAASAMATVVATEHFGSIGPGIAVGTLTILILVFGEITPKSLATRYAERISLFVAPIMLAFMRLIYPLVWMFRHFTAKVDAVTGSHGDPIVTESELISMVEHGEEEGTIESQERAMIQRVFMFSDLKVEDVMTPRRQVLALDGRRSLEDILPEVRHSHFNRIPLFAEDPDEIRHVLYVRDLLDTVADGALDQPAQNIAREPHYAPVNQPIVELIATMQRKKVHLAVVVDELGTMQGVVTMEDLLEELVGEIYDESDVLPKHFVELPDERISVEGVAELRVVEDFFGIDLPGKPTDTVNRWLLRHIERIPQEDERFVIDGLDVSVQNASDRGIHQVVLGRAETPKTVGPSADQ